ncbi:hypothetical protein BOTCAL_0128g00010 [Botryotinia calthae]|uniref:Uncharacterized protein n=1 Tax=Botryotinia calthae TaxID=38488 RepID=A0A4Y8D699_9HELO|nr:hypothetical protein BOTCAL_0128g00010 [Botryotinia calthae]
MEVYISVYDLMLAKAISYGYVKQQVLDILSESHDRVELSTFKHIPDGEKYWMAEQWTWETLCLYFLFDQLSEDTNILAVANESTEFPGEKPKWKRVSNYLKHNLPAAGETSKNTQVEANDSTTSPKLKCKNCLAVGPQSLRDETSEAKISVPKRIVCVDAFPEISSSKQVPKPETRLPPTSTASSSSERGPNKRQKLTESSGVTDENNPKLPGGVSTTVSPLTDAKCQKRKPIHRANRILVTDAQEPQYSSALQETISKM